MGVLSADDVRAWRMRIPQIVIAWTLPLTAAVLVAAYWNEPFEDETIQDVVSLEAMAGYVMLWLFALSTLFGWLRPRLGMWILMGCLLLLAPSTRTPVEFGIEILWFGLFITDIVLARRQASLARGWPRLEHRPLDPEPVLTLNRSAPGASWVMSGMSFAMAIGVLGLWVNASQNLADFDARALSRDAEVTALDTTFDYVDFRVDGDEFETQVGDATDYEIGEPITVRVDPTGEFNPLGPEDSDPQLTTLWGPLCAPLFLLSVILWLTPRFRHRDRKRAFADSRPVRALVKPPTAGGGIVLLAGDGTPFAFSRKVSTHYDLSRYDSLAAAPRKPEDVHEARVYGLTRYGRTALVEIPDLGMLLVPKTPLRDPFTARALFRRVVDRPG